MGLGFRVWGSSKGTMGLGFSVQDGISELRMRVS